MAILKKSLGQHFLTDEDVIEHILDVSPISAEDLVIEIGPGEGALTIPVFKNKKFTKYTAVELDKRFIEELKKTIKDSRFSIVNQSILEFEFPKNIKHIVLGNIPYYITSSILKKLVAEKDQIKTAVLMIQDEVALKLIKTSGKDYTPLSLLIQYHFEITLHNKVFPKSFSNPPKVNSRIITLVPRNDIKIKNEEEFWKMIRILFKEPRRTILNNIKGTYLEKILSDKVTSKRAQEFDLNELINIFNLTTQDLIV